MTIRERESQFTAKHRKDELKFYESTYHFSSEQKEREFIKAQFSTKDELDKYYDYRKEWHRRSNELDTGEAPLAVICELVSMCNLKCDMCYTNTEEFQEAIVGAQRILPWDSVKKIVDECVDIGVCSMLFSWRGESALYKSTGADGKLYDFADVLAYAQKKGILEVTSLTNGRALTVKLIKKIVLAQPNWISFSIDGMGANYDKIRKSVKGEDVKNGESPFKIVIDNIKKLIEIRDKQGFTRPQIRTNSIYPPIANAPEKYKSLMEDLGVGLVTVNEILDFRGAELPKDAISDKWFCQYPFQRLVVSANGVIMACPGAHNEEDGVVLGRYIGSAQKEINKSKAFEIKNYKEMSLKEAWASQKLKKIQSLHKTNHRKDINACKHCRHGAVTHGVTWIPDDWDMESMNWGKRDWRNG